jgi:tRNA-dihydrouridine synthase B
LPASKLNQNSKLRTKNLPKKPFWALAPMANITTYPFASQCADFGADLLWTPMVHVDTILNNWDEAEKILNFQNPVFQSGENICCHSALDAESKIPRPAGRQAAFAGMKLKGIPNYIIQLVGSDPEKFSEAIKFIEKNKLKPLGFDINCGCPDKNIVKSGCGGSLLNSPGTIIDIVNSAKRATTLPISVKTRVGYDNSDEIFKLVPKLILAGVSMITVHPRTVKQGYAGQADWNIIKDIHSSFFMAQSSALLVGSGDVKTWQEVMLRQKETNCHGVMIGRGALGRPWIFEEIKKQKDKTIKLEEIKDLILDLATKADDIWGDKGVIESRKHFAWYSKGFKGAKTLRSDLMKVTNLDEVLRVLKEG